MDDGQTSVHLCGQWGELRSLDGDLCSLGDLIGMVANLEGVPLKPAALKVLDLLELYPHVSLYVTQPADWAVRLDGATARKVGWYGERVSRPRAIKQIRSHWKYAGTSDYVKAGPAIGRGRAALLQADADALFPDLVVRYIWDEPETLGEELQAIADQNAGPSADARLKQIDPEGGLWPRQPGAPWTDAERVALFKMRHLRGLSGEELAEIAGVSRQRINEQIGPAKLVGEWWSALPWLPSQALVRECCSPLPPLPPLHAVVDDLTRADP